MSNQNNYANYQAYLLEQGIDPVVDGGLAGERGIIPKPTFTKTSGEKVFEGITSTRIVLGSDRKDVIGSGYGGLGEKGSGTIDLVAEPVLSLYDPKTDKQYCDVSFKYDAARVYIAGKTNIDDYFGLNDSEGLSKGRSSVALFSDCTRIFARQDVRIVSGMSNQNALGGKIFKSYNIQLIGKNDVASLQPAVKGGNLVEFSQEILDLLDSFLSVFDKIVMLQNQYNSALANHYHYSPFMGNPTTPSEQASFSFAQVSPQLTSEVKSSLLMLRNKMASLKNNYLSGIGGQSILSENVEIN